MRVRRGPRELEFWTAWSPAPRGEPLSFLGAREAAGFLRALLDDGVEEEFLRRLLTDEVRQEGVDRFDRAELTRQLGAHLAAGRLHVAESVLASPVLPILVEEEAPVDEPPLEPIPVADEHWIGIRVVDDASGQPVAGVKIELRRPNGATETVQTGGDGVAEIHGLQPGTADIVHVLDDEGFEVVSMS